MPCSDSTFDPLAGPIFPLSHLRTEIITTQPVYFVQVEGEAAYNIYSDTAISVWQKRDQQWYNEGDIEAGSLRLRVNEQQILAIVAKKEDATVNISQLSPPQLLIEQYYSDIKPTLLAPFAGSSLLMVVDIEGLLEGEPLPEALPTATFQYSGLEEKQQPTEFPVTLEGPDLYQHFGIESDYRKLLSITIPNTMQAGFGYLTIEWDGVRSSAIDFEIANERYSGIRARFAEEFGRVAKELIGPSAKLLAWHNPLPQGAVLVDGLSDTQITEVPEGEWLLYFAFDGESLFEQDKTLWFLVNIETSEIIDFESTVWPDVALEVESDDPDDLGFAPIVTGPNFGAINIQQNGFFDAGDPPLFQEKPAGPAPKPLPKKKPAPVTTGFLAKHVGCPKIRKIAILVQLDDNTAPTNKKGKPIPNFDKVMKKEKSIMQGLGFDPIVELKPDDFITDHTSSGRPTFSPPLIKGAFTSKPRPTFNSLKPLFDTISKQFEGQKDCCFELVIFINAHQNKQNALIYSNKGVPYKGKPGKTKDIKGKISLSTLSLLVARHIEALSKKFNPPCQPPTEMIVHSCYSGKFGDGQFDKANKAGLGMTVSSSGKQTTKGKPGAYYFLDALAACIKRNPGKTLAELFDCIVKETDKLAKGKQTPKRKPSKK